jgi:hypothetical protein
VTRSRCPGRAICCCCCHSKSDTQFKDEHTTFSFCQVKRDPPLHLYRNASATGELRIDPFGKLRGTLVDGAQEVFWSERDDRWSRGRNRIETIILVRNRCRPKSNRELAMSVHFHTNPYTCSKIGDATAESGQMDSSNLRIYHLTFYDWTVAQRNSIVSIEYRGRSPIFTLFSEQTNQKMRSALASRVWLSGHAESVANWHRRASPSARNASHQSLPPD